MSDLLTFLAAIIGAGGLAGLVTTLYTRREVRRKMGAEVDTVSVSAAQGAVIVQQNVLDRVWAQMDRFESDMEEERTERERLEVEVNALRTQLANVIEERDALKRENSRLRDRIQHLERKVQQLEARN